MISLNLKQALYIKTISETGTLTSAARALYISQPSLSQTLKQIEAEAGVALFNRSTTPFRLTYAGDRYLKAAEAMLEIDAGLKAEMENIRHEASGRLRLGISVTRAMQVLPEVLPVFMEKYPQVSIELTEASWEKMDELLYSGKIDLALAAMESSGMHVTYELIERESIGILAGKGSAIAERIPSGVPIRLDEVYGEHFVELEEGHSSRVIQDRLFAQQGLNPKIILKTDSLEVGRRVALKTRSCMLLPDVYADDYVRQCGGSFYPLMDYENHRHFYACYRNGDVLPKYTRDFIRITASVLAASQY